MLRGSVARRPSRILLALVVVALAAVISWRAESARAATTWTVTTTADGDDGSCTATQCTLRDAINYSSPGDTVIVPAASQPYTLTQGELNVFHDLTITGGGAGSTIVSGNDQSRVFYIDNASTATISGLTITHGNGTGGELSQDGGGISAYGTLTLVDSVVTDNTEGIGTGGGIYTIPNSTVTLQDSTVSNNSTAFAGGGGIYADGTWTITGSTITNNSSGGIAGGIFDNADSMTITNSTIEGNAASVEGGEGGGIFQFNSLSLTNVTLANNSAPDGANLYVDDTSSGGFQNTIFSAPQGGGTNCDTSGELPQSNGNNLNSDSSDCWDPSTTQSSDKTGVDPKLGPLADNGGPTQTMALLAGSPAIDAGATVAGVTTDQRGGPRPQGAAADIGAYEVGALVDMAITKSASPSPATAGQPLTYTVTATNTGPTSDPGYGVSVSDTLPSGVTFVSAKPSQGSCSHSGSTVTCALGTVAKGASATITIVVTPAAAGSLTNTARVSSSGLDSNTANNSASVTTQVKAGAAAASGAKAQVSTGNATDITFTGATLHGTVNPEGASTIYYFDYGNANYDPVTVAGVAGSGTTARKVSAKATGLKPGKLYHFRIVAQNSHGTVFGADHTFRTPQRPSLHVAPDRVRPGAAVRVFGNAGACPVGDQVTLLSHAFSGAHEFAGVPAVFARVRSGGSYSTNTRVPSGRAAGHYLVTARCGGGNLGVSAHLTVFRPAVPKFTG